jgi:hypothetical protein
VCNQAKLLGSFGVVLLAVFAARAPAIAASRAGHRALKVGPCHVRGGKLLFGDGQVELVQGPWMPGFYGSDYPKWRLYSCTRHGSPHFVLAIGNTDSHTGTSIHRVTLSGHYCAFFVVSGSVGTDLLGQVRLVDLATGRLVASEDSGSTYGSALTALVLDDVGTAAWTYSSMPFTTGQAGPPVTLWGASTVRRAALLATGAIDPSSVAVAGTVVSWVEAGAPAQQDLGTP